MSRQCPERLLPSTGAIRSFFELRWAFDAYGCNSLICDQTLTSFKLRLSGSPDQIRHRQARPGFGLGSGNPRGTREKKNQPCDAIHVSRLLTGARVRKHSRARLLIVTSSRPPHLSNTHFEMAAWMQRLSLSASIRTLCCLAFALPGLGYLPPRAASWLPSSKPLMTDSSPWRKGKSNGHGRLDSDGWQGISRHAQRHLHHGYVPLP